MGVKRQVLSRSWDPGGTGAALTPLVRPLLLAPFLLLVLSAPCSAQTLGYNLGWIEGKYGRDLTTAFDEADWRRVLRRTRVGGGAALRVWLFEGQQKEGVVWSGHRPDGLDPSFLRNTARVIELAREEQVQIYWTAFTANWAPNWERGTIHSERHYNLLNDRYGHGQRFREVVLAPLLDLLARNPDVTWGFDLMNEVQGSTRPWFWSDGWIGARKWIREWAAFVQGRCPGIQVTASSGHHTASVDILSGRFDGLGLDFLDVHVYSDRGTIPLGWWLARHARRQGIPLVVGEVGQKGDTNDPAFQARLLARFLDHARERGVAAVFPWRLEDAQRDGARFTFWEPDGEPRPAVDVMRAFAVETGQRLIAFQRGLSERLPD